jgi:hypothetical protein
MNKAMKILLTLTLIITAASILSAQCTKYDPNQWPADIIANVADLHVRFESRSFWTLYRINYKEKILGIDQFGSHYGTVARFPGIGFIGSGHRENEDERILSLQLKVDGKPVTKPAQRYDCKSIELLKTSRIKNLTFNTYIKVADNRIDEEVTLKALSATDVNSVIFFMHPWSTDFSDYAAFDTDPMITGKFADSKKFMIEKPARMTSVYCEKLQMGVVEYLSKVPENVIFRTRYWDVPKRYRKHYLRAFINSTIPPDTEFTFHMTTVPFQSEPDNWLKNAKRTAASLLVQP